jgi:hypothetical protein
MKDPYDPYVITLNDGKYTVTHTWGQPLQFQRHGEPWPGADDLRYANVVVAMAERIKELEIAIREVLDGTLDERGKRNLDGLTFGSVFAMSAQGQNMRDWETKLRNVLEQKS